MAVKLYSKNVILKSQKYKYLAKIIEVVSSKSNYYAWSRILSIGNS